jgi:hypothetical protein
LALSSRHPQRLANPLEAGRDLPFQSPRLRRGFPTLAGDKNRVWTYGLFVS